MSWACRLQCNVVCSCVHVCIGYNTAGYRLLNGVIAALNMAADRCRYVYRLTHSSQGASSHPCSTRLDLVLDNTLLVPGCPTVAHTRMHARTLTNERQPHISPTYPTPLLGSPVLMLQRACQVTFNSDSSTSMMPRNAL